MRRPSSTPAAGLVVLVAVVAAVLALLRSGGPASGDAGGNASTDASPPAAPPTTAVRQLDALALVTAGPSTAYHRDAFGPAWTDTDRNGCDTRNDVLRRDLVRVVLKPGTRDCVVASGTLTDPYTGASVLFLRGGGRVEIDHVVSLADAWRSGASTWPDAKRLALANDPLDLLASESGVNQAKGSLNASGWLPSTPAGRCRLAQTQVAVKAKYGLGVTGTERAALAGVLQGCPETQSP